MQKVKNNLLSFFKLSSEFLKKGKGLFVQFLLKFKQTIKNLIFKFFSKEFLGIAPKYKIALLWMLILSIIPAFGKYSITELFLYGNIYLIYATAWDLLSGYTGQESFGHSLFIGMAAYLTGFLGFKLMDLGILSFATPFVVNLLLGALLAAVFGLLIGIPSLKLKGPFLALATLSSAALGREMVMVFSSYTGGEEGMSGIPSVSGFSAYYLSLLIMALGVGISYVISRSKYGTLLKGIREDEAAAKAIGINTTFYKVGTFMISAALAGLAGAFHAYYNSSASPSLISSDLSIEIITFAVVGGIGTITGPIGGVYFLWILGYFLNSWIPEFKTIIYMILMVMVMILMPKGAFTSLVEKISGVFETWKKNREGKNT